MFDWMKKKGKMKREIIINSENLEIRVGVLENGKLEEYQVEHPTEERIVGSIFKGKIQNLEHDLQAAFVDIGLNKNAFLHYWDMVPDDKLLLDAEGGGNRNRGRNRGRGKGKGKGKGQGNRKKRYSNAEIEKLFAPGKEIIVQVTKGPIGTKGPRITANLSLPGRYLVMMPGSKMKGVSRKIGDVKERIRLKKLLDKLQAPQGTGLIVRTAAVGVGARSIMRDMKGLVASWEDLQTARQNEATPACIYQEPDLVERVVRDWLTEEVDRIVIDAPAKYDKLKEIASRISHRAKSKIHLYKGDLPIFDYYDVESQLDLALRRTVKLKSGGVLVFDETEAMIAVDVNTGRHKGNNSQEQAILEVNMEAVEEVARQLRLRNIGGLVVIDLIDMKPKKHQNAVYRAMRAALKRDKSRTNVLSISELGLMEMTRQRAAESILSVMYDDCPYCHGRGKVKSSLGMSVDIQRQISAVGRKTSDSSTPLDLQITVHPTVMDRLRSEDEEFLIDLESKFDGRLRFMSDSSKHVESFDIRNTVTEEMIYSTGDK